MSRPEGVLRRREIFHNVHARKDFSSCHTPPSASFVEMT